MGAVDNLYSTQHLLGNVNLPRITNPSIRGSIRRHDPDGTHSSPYFLSLTGKSLTIVLTGIGTFVANFTSDLMSDAITVINALSPVNLLAEDDDGYLRITFLNGGAATAISTTAGTAAAILGFVLPNEPGYISYAGELDVSSPGRGITVTQSNPQGTALIAQDEDLTSNVINRAIYGVTSDIERYIRDLDKLVPVWKSYNVTTTTLPVTGDKVFTIADSTLRFPVDWTGVSGSNPTSAIIDQLVRLINTDSSDYYDITQVDPIPHVSKVIYNDGTVGVADNTHTFGTWGTPDGKSVFGSTAVNKQAPVSITAIRGNVIEADTALFQTNSVQVGDTVVIEGATNTVPFSHNGEFIVANIYDNLRIAVRPKGPLDKSYVSTSFPTELNRNLPGGTSYGTVRVIVGAYLPGSALTFVLPSWVPSGTGFIARVLCGVRLRDMRPGDFGSQVTATQEGIASILYKHITNAATGFRHAAGDVDAPAVVGSPNSLASGTVATQLAALLGYTNSIPATSVNYGGGGNWADGTTNPATTVESQLDKIITDLTGTAGTGKIQGSAVGSDLAAETLALQISDLVNNWLKLSRANTVTGINTFGNVQTFNGASGDTNPSVQMTSTPTNRKLWAQLTSKATGSGKVRVYSGSGFEVTVNAVWGGSTWSKDTNGTAAFQLTINSNYLTISYQDSAADTAWADTAWTSQFFKIDQATATSIIKQINNTIITGDGTNFNNTVLQMKVGNDSQAAPLVDYIGKAGLGGVMIDPMGGLYRKGQYFFDDFLRSTLDSGYWTITNTGGAGTDTVTGSVLASTVVTGLNHVKTISGPSFCVNAKNFPRFRTRIYASDINNTTLSGQSCGIRAGFQGAIPRACYLYFSEVHNANFNWWLNVDGTLFDTGLPSIMDAGIGTSASQILHIAVTGTRTIEVAVHTSSSASPETWVSTSRALITTSVDIRTDGQWSPFISLIDEFGQTGTPTINVDFVEVYTANRFD